MCVLVCTVNSVLAEAKGGCPHPLPPEEPELYVVVGHWTWVLESKL